MPPNKKAGKEKSEENLSFKFTPFVKNLEDMSTKELATQVEKMHEEVEESLRHVCSFLSSNKQTTRNLISRLDCMEKKIEEILPTVQDKLQEMDEKLTQVRESAPRSDNQLMSENKSVDESVAEVSALTSKSFEIQDPRRSRDVKSGLLTDHYWNDDMKRMAKTLEEINLRQQRFMQENEARDNHLNYDNKSYRKEDEWRYSLGTRTRFRDDMEESHSYQPIQSQAYSSRGVTFLVSIEDLHRLMNSVEKMSPPRFLQHLESLLVNFGKPRNEWIDYIFQEARGYLRAWLIRTRHKFRSWDEFTQMFLKDHFNHHKKEEAYNQIWNVYTWDRFLEEIPNGSLVRYLLYINEKVYDVGFYPNGETGVVKRIIKNLPAYCRHFLMADEGILTLDDLEVKLRGLDEQRCVTIPSGGEARLDRRSVYPQRRDLERRNDAEGNHFRRDNFRGGRQAIGGSRIYKLNASTLERTSNAGDEVPK